MTNMKRALLHPIRFLNNLFVNSEVGTPHQFPAARLNGPGAIVRVYGGTDIHGLDYSFGGDAPSIALYDETGELWGGVNNKGLKIPEGGYKDFQIIQNEYKKDVRVAYPAFSACKNSLPNTLPGSYLF
jgi:hypothetical protein